MLKIYSRILILGIVISCSNLTPNKDQIKSTNENIECYQRLVSFIKNDTLKKNLIIKLRDSKLRGESDPIFVKSKYRLIDLKEFDSLLPEAWNKCFEKVKENNDLIGLRYISNNLIILEIDKFRRRTFSEKYSKDNTLEIHRIIISNSEYDDSKFKFKGEKIKWNFDLGNNWNYEISHSLR